MLFRSLPFTSSCPPLPSLPLLTPGPHHQPLLCLLCSMAPPRLYDSASQTHTHTHTHTCTRTHTTNTLPMLISSLLSPPSLFLPSSPFSSPPPSSYLSSSPFSSLLPEYKGTGTVLSWEGDQLAAQSVAGCETTTHSLDDTETRCTIEVCSPRQDPI